MFNRLRTFIHNTKSNINGTIEKTKASVPTLPKITLPTLPKITLPTLSKITLPTLPKITLPTLPKITLPIQMGLTSDFKTLVNHQIVQLKKIKLESVALPITQSIKIVGKSTANAGWVLIKLFFRTRFGNVIKWAIGLTSLSFLGYIYGTTEVHHVTVSKAYHKIKNGETKLVVIEKNGDVYHVTNSLMWGQMNADGIFARIHAENTYKFRTYGLELSSIGIHKNIVHIVDEM
jgi:hypothetical protein